MMDLFSPIMLGDLQLRNRIIMAPMTRSRAAEQAVPSEVMIEYYRQRAGAGLIISEGIAPSADGLGYCRTSGLYNQGQVNAWSAVTRAVHDAGGCIAAQIMHVGRVASALNKPAGSESVAPSALRARGEMYTDEGGMQPFDEPRALESGEIPQVIDDYRSATENAFAAGFDAVELHCTSGYLPAQFLSSGTNQRDDAYGGSVANRVRFVLEVLQAMISVNGSGRVGMRICPDNPFNDLQDDNPQETFEYLLHEVQQLDLAYLHVIRFPRGRVDNIALGQRFFGDRLIGNESYSFEEAQQCVLNNELTAVSFGRSFIGNPDLVQRWKNGDALAEFDLDTLYTPGEQGYTTYRAHDAQ
jgi:N-ethylmaleimide reductase